MKKAFDRVRHEKLFEALDRAGIPQELVDMVEALYENPDFVVELGGHTSATHTQHRGIRQGCPLSPYLFTILTSVLFKDIQNDDTQDAYRHRPEGLDFDEILYADDTALFSTTAPALTRLLGAV